MENTNIETSQIQQSVSQIKDSGERREFQTGAVRDIQEGKGRCDLLPIDIIASLMEDRCQASVLHHIGEFMSSGQDRHLFLAIRAFQELTDVATGSLLREVSVHYEQGALKYGERNWEKGIPLHCYIDSGVRHFLKFIDHEVDERHDRAFVWNMLCAIWTMKHKPELIDIPFALIGNGLRGKEVADSEDSQYSETVQESNGPNPHIHGGYADESLRRHVGRGL